MGTKSTAIAAIVSIPKHHDGHCCGGIRLSAAAGKLPQVLLYWSYSLEGDHVYKSSDAGHADGDGV